MDVTASYLLGCVTSVFDSPKNRVAKLDPLIDFGPDGRVAVARISREQRLEFFPNTGRVAWYGALDDAEEGTLWCFQSSETPTYDSTKSTHDLMATDGRPDEAIEVIDVRQFGDANRLREALSGEGLSLFFTPCRRVYLWVSDSMWVGPVHLVPAHEEAHRWLIDPVALHKLVPNVVPVPEAVGDASVEGLDRHFLAPRARPRQAAGLDWSPDEEVLKRILRWVAKRSPEFDGQMRLTKAIVDHATDVVLRREAGTSDADLNGDRLERARLLVERVVRREELADAIVDSLVKLPRFQTELKERVEEKAKAAVDEALRHIAAQVAEADRKVAQAATRLDELEAEQGRLESEISGYEEMRAEDERRLGQARAEIEQELADLATQRASAEEELANHFRALIAEPPTKLLAQVAVLRLLAGVGGGIPVAGSNGHNPDDAVATPPDEVSARVRQMIAPSSPSDAPHAQALPAPAAPARPTRWELGATQVAPISEFADVRRAIRAASARARFARDGALALHVALLSDAIPVVAGPRALDILEAYADTICGGRILWVPVSPASVTPTDLFGRVDPKTGVWTLTNALLDTLEEAVRWDDLLLVVLDGVNRGPMDSYLTPLLECYRTRHRELRARELPLVRGVRADGRPADRPFTWPRNVLLAGTWAGGPTTLPPSRAFWDYAALVPLDQYPAPADASPCTDAESTEREATGVTIATWNAWREEARRCDASAVREMLARLGDVLPSGADPTAECLFSAAMQWFGAQEETGCAEVIASRLIPAAAADGALEALRRALTDDGRWSSELDRLTAVATKLCE